MTTQIQRGKVITVDRSKRKIRAGQGLFQGMVVIWRHWTQSFRKLENMSQTAGTFTVEYPDEQLKLPEAYRNMPVLLYDDETGHELCTSCFQCERICPPQVIHMTQTKDPNTGKAVPAVAEFIIEYDACMSCGFCAEVCPFDAIKMDHEFELSTANHPALTVHKEGLNRPISYYASIAPEMWAAVKDSAYKKLQGNIKRRSGLIGIAPQMVERLKAKQAAPAKAAAPSAAKPAAPAAKPAAPATAAGKNMSEDKAARLAAIRAANAAKTGGAAPVESAPDAQPAAPAAKPAAPVAAGKNMSEDKAARLAAIRAANVAKTGGAAPVESAPAASAQSDGDGSVVATLAEDNGDGIAGAPKNTRMSEEQQAKLHAIREANRAKREQG
ncbi:MAG: 4Fe-4S binding protein [Chloroflexales bacterium]|nr:4Fe-4S binding protein [Chloroflexales bacterium]